MDERLAKRFGNELIKLGNKIQAGTSELTEDEAMCIMSIIAHQPISREEACNYVNMNSNKFADNITLGNLPKGRKRRGFKELTWYKDELDKAIEKLKTKYKR